MAAATRETIPRPALLGAAALMALSVGLAGLGRAGWLGSAPSEREAVVETREILFSDRDDGAVAVSEPHAAEPFAVLAPGTNGFVRGALRGLVRERKRRLIGAETPFLLVRQSDGRLLLQDQATDTIVDLGAFGPSNIDPFIRLMTLNRGPS